MTRPPPTERGANDSAVFADRPCLPAWVWLFVVVAAMLIGATLTLASPARVSAQTAACITDAEPNDAPEEAATFSPPGCLTGTLPDGDPQDLLLWTIGPADAAQRWSFTLDGPPGTLTSAQLVPITSEPGVTPITAGSVLWRIDRGPTEADPAVITDVLLPPGRYILGVTRSASLEDGPLLDLDYRLDITPGTPLPASVEQEPNDDATTATALTGLFEVGGDLDGSQDWYRWTIEDDLAGRPLVLAATGPEGLDLSVTLYRPESSGTSTYVKQFRAGDDGSLRAEDLVLPPGELLVAVTPQRDGTTPYTLAATVSDVTDADPEPNDEPADAVVLQPGQMTIRGRLTEGDTRDRYRFTVDATLGDVLLDMRLLWRDGPPRDLCIETLDGSAIQCRNGDTGVALSGLRLAPGDYLLDIDGDPAPFSPYLLRIDATTAAATDFESEPNDQLERATPMTAGEPMHGAFGVNDPDMFRVHVDGDTAQLWQVDVTGDRLYGLVWLQRTGVALVTARPDDIARTTIRLTDLFLIPGDHWFRVDGERDGSYRIAFTPLGPPDPDGEHEANDTTLTAEALPIGRDRTGRLPSMTDVDVFRFSVDTADHLAITLRPPPDAISRVRLEGGGLRVAERTGEAPGDAVTWDGIVQPGDYEISLWPQVPSEGRYTLHVERLDPFLRAIDQEPNDRAADANPLPDTLRLEGSGTPNGDLDWYRLGSLPNGGDLGVIATGARRIHVTDGTDRWDATPTTDASGAAATPDPSGALPFLITGLPAEVPLSLVIDATGPYLVELDPGTTGLPAAVAPLPPLEARVTLAAPVTAVAAYRWEGQVLEATATIHNGSADALTLSLDLATSSRHWSAAPATSDIDIPPGASLDVPVTIRILPDAPADTPVRITLRARDASGRSVTGALDARAERDLEPVAPYRAWTVPDQLLGGLDVASAALGGEPWQPLDPTSEAELYDGTTTSGRGYVGAFDGTPVTFSVDLAGDVPVPVAGMILDPLGRRSSADAVPREVTLLLSDDGQTWEEVLRGELTPLDLDQSFVLPEPIEARYAQLRIESTWGGAGSALVLGDFHVIAVPGAVPVPMPPDISDPSRGGHVVWMAPQAAFQADADAMLVDDPTGPILRVSASAGTRLTWVVGFQDDRQALLDHLTWQDPADTVPTQRLRFVDVEVSTTSPLGPWTSLGRWTLDRAPDGSVEPFPMPDGTWARFLRFTGSPLDEDVFTIEVPALLQVVEHATDASYRSVMGAWGQAESMGPRDLLEPSDLVGNPDVDADDDTPATATDLLPDRPATGRVHRGEDVDWYRVTVPDDQRSLSITVAGAPSVGVALTMTDAAGTPVPLVFTDGDEPGTVRYAANVTPGETYLVQVVQPPFSAVFTFDTSGSIGPYLAFVQQALRTYAQGVVEGEEQVLIVPFEEAPLLDAWSSEPYQLQDAVNRYAAAGGSSGAEAALMDAAEQLAGREGARAVLMVTDAETSSYADNQRLWRILDAVRPMVFAVHVGGDGTPRESRAFLQDWTMASGGHYQYALSHGEIDGAFDRMATWLRRPVPYRLDLSTSADQLPPPTPGTLAVVAPADADGTQSAVIGRDVAVALVLDTSGSMLEPFGGERRMDVARRVLVDLVRNDLPPGLPVALRTFERARRSCETELAVPLGPLDPDAMAERIQGLRILRSVRTPLAAAIRAVGDDLAGVTGPRIVIVVSDGQESCDGDPEAEVRALVAAGYDVTLNVVGLSLDDARVRRSIQRLARLGNGTYFDARDPDQVATAIRAAVSAPFQVFDQAGALVASGTVGGAAVELPPGTYRVVVRSDPQAVYEGIVVTSEGSVVVTLPTAGERPSSTDVGPGTSPSPETGG
ncbi:MAG: VWA domain-containing protein [Chloroflexi bacterium]|nr:VWA domain-containing protein [Chloroflexota bacterium]